MNVRILEYRLKLGGPYCVVSDREIRCVQDSGTGIEAPRIGLEVEVCSDLETWLSEFRCVLPEDEAEMAPRKRELLLGRDPEWRLTGVRVAPGLLWLDYTSPQRYQECVRLAKAAATELPSYHVALVSELSEKVSARLRLETPRVETGEDDEAGESMAVETTWIEIGYFGSVAVIETEGLKRRRLEFAPLDLSAQTAQQSRPGSLTSYDAYVWEYL